MGSRRWLLPVLLLLASVASERQGVSRDDASSAAHPGNLQDGEDSGEAADERTWVPRHRVSPPHHWNSANVLSQWHQRKVAEVEQQQALGRLDTALKLCETLLRTEPTHAPTLTLKAKVLDAKGLFSAARRSAQLAIDADPRFTPAYKLLGELYVAQGQRHLRQPELRDYEAAYEAFRRIVLLDLERNILPSTVMARAYDGMARALDAAGAEAAALSNLETAITISPGDATLQHRFGHLLLERAARLGGDGALVPVADENRTASALRRALHLQYHPLLWLHVVAVKQVAYVTGVGFSERDATSRMLQHLLQYHNASRVRTVCLDLSRPLADPDAAGEGTGLGVSARVGEKGGDAVGVMYRRECHVFRHLGLALLDSDLPGRFGGPRVGGAAQAEANSQGGNKVSLLAGMVRDEEPELVIDLCGHRSLLGLQVMSTLTAQGTQVISLFGHHGTVGALPANSTRSLKWTDAAATPPETAPLFAERLVYVGEAGAGGGGDAATFLLNSVPDAGLIAARKAEQRRRARPHTRREMKLPEGAVVFAYFGDLVYVDHSCWHAWMEIVRLVPGSVLWLALGNASADTTVNVHKHALEYGLPSRRVVVAELPGLQLLTPGLMSLADVMLDSTLHNTPPEYLLQALWAGVAPVTMAGAGMHQRTTASALRSLGLGMLIVEEYELSAVRLGQQRDLRRSLRLRLLCSRPRAYALSDIDPAQCDPSLMAGGRKGAMRGEQWRAWGQGPGWMGFSLLWQRRESVAAFETALRMAREISLAAGTSGGEGSTGPGEAEQIGGWRGGMHIITAGTVFPNGKHSS